MVRCARFYPQTCNTGGFFVCIIQKSAAAPLGPPVSKFTDKQLEGRGAHPLLSTKFHPISATDSAWKELTSRRCEIIRGVQDKLERRLLFWQTMKGKSEPERVTLVSEAVANLWAAKPCDGRKVAWARLGVFLFEQLPKGLLSGVAPCRWRLHAEGVVVLAPILQSRRVCLEPALVQQVLCCEHRQTALTEGTPLANAVANGAGGNETEYHHVCGGIMVNMGHSWFPGVVTPKQLRILVDDDAAEALLEQIIPLAPAPLQRRAVLVKDPARLNVARFQRISSFLEVVVGLLLGFFLSSSMQRWYSCTNGFLELFDAIRGLHMQLNAMGVAKELASAVL
eukprot:s5723_g1.t1